MVNHHSSTTACSAAQTPSGSQLRQPIALAYKPVAITQAALPSVRAMRPPGSRYHSASAAHAPEQNTIGVITATTARRAIMPSLSVIERASP
ncbi:hypothetical protein [Rhodanobacter lindaniclasticus]